MTGRGWALLWLGAIGTLVTLYPTLRRWWTRLRGLDRPVDASRRCRLEDLPAAATLFRDYQADQHPTALDDRTWRDLDLDRVFAEIDRTISEPGRQLLYSRLRTHRSLVASLPAFEAAVSAFAADPSRRAEVRRLLAPLADDRAGYLVHLILGEVPRRPRGWWLFPLLASASLACLALAPVMPRLLLAWLGVCVVNVAVQAAYKPRVRHLIPALRQVPRLIDAARNLARPDIVECASQRQALGTGAAQLRQARRATGWLQFEPDRSDGLLSALYEYVNIALLLDVCALVFAIDAVRRGDHARLMLEALAYLDCAQSVATWRCESSRWTRPDFAPVGKSMDLTALYHPLVSEPVPNDFTLDAQSALVTGSNMAGKSTFIRAIGVNAVLAQALNTACAVRWVAPPLDVRSSIEHSDSVAEGRSYYLAEVEDVRRLVRAANAEHQHLFLLDELFRGTNTTERVAAAYAVLSYLNRGPHLVVAATHDIELATLLGGAFVVHHFRESVTSQRLSFDYVLHPGVSSTRNAIALLGLMDYPTPLVEAALGAVNWQANAT